MKKIRVGIIGATGYGGRETIKLLVKHPAAEITLVSADDSFIGTRVQDTYPELSGVADLTCVKTEAEAFVKKCDVVMLATPNAVAMKLAPEFLRNNVKVIDYSGDFRLKDLKVYESAYGIKHASPELVPKADYGMPELYADKIKKATLISNPGCFPTSVILGLAPICARKLAHKRMVSVSITGTSGAGRKGALPLIQSEVENTVRPYKVGAHQHEPEINEILADVGGEPVSVTFVPELGPFSRGIQSTITLHLKAPEDAAKLVDLYRDFYKGQPFVRVLDKGRYPELKNVVHTNFCDIGIFSKPDNTCVVFSAVDNLVKGLSGQAAQNMNLMFGLDQATGIL
jgi:N-acetyl-gamma-glutamyl-phosphate reductase